MLLSAATCSCIWWLAGRTACTPRKPLTGMAAPPLPLLLQGAYSTALRRYRQSYQYLSWTTFKHRTGDGDVDLSHEEQVGGCVCFCVGGGLGPIKAAAHKEMRPP